MGLSNMKLTHVVTKVYYDQVLGWSAYDPLDCAKTPKVLLYYILLVECCGHIPALDGGAVRGRHATQAL